MYQKSWLCLWLDMVSLLFISLFSLYQLRLIMTHGYHLNVVLVLI